MSQQPLSISGYSTALFASWYFIEQYGVLFDCGDGCTSALLQKAGRVRHVFVSHADRDHLTGLLQFNQLNAKESLRVYYPRDCGSFPAFQEFISRFDSHMPSASWRPMAPGEEIPISKNRVVRAVENRHIDTDGVQAKSLSFWIDSVTRKLKPELQGLAGEQIAQLRLESGENAITDEVRTTKVIYSGDTPVEFDGRYDRAEVLIHEATFLKRDELSDASGRYNHHSSLDDVIRMVAESQVGTLVLGHFSSRYDHAQIRDAVRRECEANALKCPVHLVLPGECVTLNVGSV